MDAAAYDRDELALIPSPLKRRKVVPVIVMTRQTHSDLLSSFGAVKSPTSVSKMNRALRVNPQPANLSVPTSPLTPLRTSPLTSLPAITPSAIWPGTADNGGVSDSGVPSEADTAMPVDSGDELNSEDTIVGMPNLHSSISFNH